jgi:hypothetical protein
MELEVLAMAVAVTLAQFQNAGIFFDRNDRLSGYARYNGDRPKQACGQPGDRNCKGQHW